MPMSASDIERLSSATPRTRTMPSASSMSCGLASSWWAAISNIFSRTFFGRAAHRAGQHHRHAASRPGPALGSPCAVES